VLLDLMNLIIVHSSFESHLYHSFFNTYKHYKPISRQYNAIVSHTYNLGYDNL
jgi:hypothetical protein